MPSRRVKHVPVLVGHRLGVHEALVLDDLAVLAGEPHLHRPVRGLHLHADQSSATDADVHPLPPGSWRRSGRTTPRSAPGRSTSAKRAAPERRACARSRPRPVPRSRHSSVLRTFVAIAAARGSRPSGRSGPPRPAGTARPRSTPPRAARHRGRTAGTGPAARASTSPARSSTLMCFEIAGSVSSNGSASSFTVASPSARRARIARRVGFASAAKVSLSRSSSIVLLTAFHTFREGKSTRRKIPLRRLGRQAMRRA